MSSLLYREPESKHSPTPIQTTVVIVDDELAIVDIVCAILEDEGIAATSCPHGLRAFTCIRTKQPKVIILDVQMPEVDGLTLFVQLRADPLTRTIPVIFYTANAHVVRKCLPNYQTMGATLLPKPFDVQALVDMVSDALAT